MLRALFITDGTSDLPLVSVIESAAFRAGHDIDVVGLPNEQIPGGGRTVAGRLQVVLANDDDFDLIIVHRDAEGDEPESRYTGIQQGAADVDFGGPVVGLVPVRMTEVFALLDGVAIREVAGTPSVHDRSTKQTLRSSPG